jgi:AcrR family transcriptional regulator
MFIQMKKRKYKQTRRAEKSQNTRQQILEATMALHEDPGPAQTSIKAVAERAGVQRLTVYRHFPDETSLFEACTSHWIELNPLPVISELSSIQNPLERASQALLRFYAYYRKTSKMWSAAYRDVGKVEALKGPMKKIESYLDSVRDDLLDQWKTDKKARQQISITLRHCLRFSTWQSLEKEQLSDEKMVDLVIQWLHD